MDDEKPLRLISEPGRARVSGFDPPHDATNDVRPVGQRGVSDVAGDVSARRAEPAGPDGAPGSNDEITHRLSDRMVRVGGDYPGDKVMIDAGTQAGAFPYISESEVLGPPRLRRSKNSARGRVSGAMPSPETAAATNSSRGAPRWGDPQRDDVGHVVDPPLVLLVCGRASAADHQSTHRMSDQGDRVHCDRPGLVEILD